MSLYFMEDLTSNCLDNKICNAILQIFNNSTLRLKGFMESEISILFYLWQCQNSLVREAKLDRSQKIRTPHRT